MKFRVGEWRGPAVEIEAASAVEAALAYEQRAADAGDVDALEVRRARLLTGELRTDTLFVQSQGEFGQWLPHVAEYRRAELPALVAREKAPRVILL